MKSKSEHKVAKKKIQNGAEKAVAKTKKKAAKPKDANPNLGKGPKAAKIWKPEIPQMLSQ